MLSLIKIPQNHNGFKPNYLLSYHIVHILDVLDDLAVLPDELLEPTIKAVIKAFANSERRKKQAGV